MDITLKQVGEITGINISTIRYYKNSFKQYFTTSGEGKSTKYEEKSTVDIMNLISNGYKRGYDKEQILELLDSKYGINVVTDLVTQEEDNSTIIAPQDLIKLFQDEMEKHNNAITELTNKVDALAQGSQSRDELLMENIRLLQAKKRKWWQWS